MTETMFAGLLGGLLGAGAALASQFFGMQWDRKKEGNRRVIEERLRTLGPLRSAVAAYIAAIWQHGATQKADPLSEGFGQQLSNRLDQLNAARFAVHDQETLRLANQLTDFLRSLMGSGITEAQNTGGNVGAIIIAMMVEHGAEIERRRVPLLARIADLIEGSDL